MSEEDQPFAWASLWPSGKVAQATSDREKAIGWMHNGGDVVALYKRPCRCQDKPEASDAVN